MTEQELKIVEAHIASVFGDWHGCRLTQDKAKKMGLPPLMLCDLCVESVAAEMKSIRQAIGESPAQIPSEEK